MKTKFRQFKSYLKRKYSENSYLLSKRLSRRWDAFLQKGHEKMTVMFIPHNEKNIFNFQISKFTVSFFIILFIIVITTSAVALYENPEAKDKELELLTNYKGIRSELLQFEKQTYKISDLIDDIKPGIEELYELAAGIDEFDDLWKVNEEKKELTIAEKKLKDLLPEEVFELQKLQKDIMNATNTIKTIKNFVNVRSKVINDTPSIVPNRGHITSLFGWRRSPFGFGRDFHSGIDIAAPHGTPIRATAPGKVVMAGWGGGYGFVVRVKHKYGFLSIYAHCSRLNVKVGQTVKKGKIVGYVGQTGSSTGNHCHYEIRLGNIPINPYPYMSRMW